MRAVRKNGDVFAGSWMIGTKWAVSFQNIAHKAFILTERILCVLSGPCASRSNDRATDPS